jgi:rRNA-processing protein FCF1
MTRVLLDTNALMLPVECDVRVFDELERVLDDPEPVVPAACVAELEKLTDGAGEEAVAASVGRDLADRCEQVPHAEQYADDAVVGIATRDADAGAAVDCVATSDRDLRDRLLARDVPVIGLRGRNELALTRP